MEGLSEATGLSLADSAEYRHYERYRAAARAELGGAAWEVSWEGRFVTLEEAIAYALEDSAEGKT